MITIGTNSRTSKSQPTWVSGIPIGSELPLPIDVIQNWKPPAK